MYSFPVDVDSEASEHPWYAVRTRSNHERTSANMLACQGYQQYLPCYKVRRRWSDRTVETSLPLFSGYVFCRFDAKRRTPVLSTPGVVSIVSFGGEPTAIDHAEIEAIRVVLHSGLAAEPCPFLQQGQSVRIKSGVMKGIEGILLRKKADWRLVVSVTLLQRSISVEVDHDSIACA